MFIKKLPRSFYERDTALVAQELLGKKLVHVINGHTLSGIIVETEAYCFDDPACHAHKGKTKRNEALFGIVGHSYVYFTYGNHYCMNVVAREKEMLAGGVLLRAIEPIDGIEYMKKARKKDAICELASGPGKLTQAMGITKKQYGIDVTTSDELYITYGREVFPEAIAATPRIGISRACEKLWRFIIKGSPFLSR